MKTEINNEIVNLFFNKMAKFFNSFFPGFIIFELFFDIGIFSKSVSNVYEFILYIIWCGIFSIPYRWIIPYNVDFFVPELQKELSKRKLLDKNGLGDTDSVMEAGDEIELGFILLKLILTVILYYIILLVPLTAFLGIPIKVIQLVVVIILMSLLSYLLSFPFVAWFRKILINAAEKMNE